MNKIKKDIKNLQEEKAYGAITPQRIGEIFLCTVEALEQKVEITDFTEKDKEQLKKIEEVKQLLQQVSETANKGVSESANLKQILSKNISEINKRLEDYAKNSDIKKEYTTLREFEVLKSLSNSNLSECVNIKETLNTFIKKVASDFVNYYTKTDVYNQNEIDSKVSDLQGKISALPKFAIKVVQELPQTEISSTTIYLLRNSDKSKNTFSEYIYVNGAWELLGSAKMDLTDYYKKNEVYSRQEIETQNKALNDSINEAFAKFPELLATIQKTNNTISAVNKRVSEVDGKFKNYAKKNGDYGTPFAASHLCLKNSSSIWRALSIDGNNCFTFNYTNGRTILPAGDENKYETIALESWVTEQISKIPKFEFATEQEVLNFLNALN